MFAHNEERNISHTLQELSRQTLLTDERLETTALYVLANGCNDQTAQIATVAIDEHLGRLADNGLAGVVDLAASGKSRTWNHFVHELLPSSVEYIFFIDADLEFPDATTLANMLDFLHACPDIDVATSRAMKTIELRRTFNPVDWLSREGSRLTQSRAQHAIAGSLYCMRASLAKKIELPIGMLGEDGFVRIAASTTGFREPPNDNRIQRVQGARHVFHPCRGVLEYLRHERRLVLGTLQNKAVWDWIRQHDGSVNPQELIRRKNKTVENWTLPILEKRVEQLGLSGMLRMAWDRATSLVRAQRGINRVAMLPIALARFVFSSLAGWMALRAVRERRVSW